MLLPFLSNHGVLGLNARNLLYIKPYNPRRAVAFADDKMKTKSFLSARGIPTARVYARIESRRQLREFDFDALPDTCVLKPNYGFGGEGILILKGRKNRQFLEQGKHPVSRERLVSHIEDILDGKFSVNGMNDTAFFERILVAHDSLTPFRPAGLPDVRIIVFNLIPVMAMLRIPTPESRGKANVHLGGIGIGLDMAKGTTTYAAQYHHMVTELPHGTPVRGMQLPFWEEMLLIASRIQYMTNIGYLAVDLTIDEEQGPVLLEVNARAGLMVQVANLAPLRARLERVKGLQVSTPEKGVRLSQELFGEKRAQRKRDDEKPVLGLQEALSFVGEEYSLEEPCVVSPDDERTVFHPSLIQQLLEHDLLEQAEGGVHRAKFSLGGKKIQTVIESGDTGAETRAVIGRRDLQGFLIDPGKRAAAARTGIKKYLQPADRALAQLDRDIALLRNIRPTNLREERERALADLRYNPVFQYAPISLDIADVQRRLQDVSVDASPLGILLERKRQELLKKLDVLQSRGNARLFSAASQALYGAPTTQLVADAAGLLATQTACELPPPPEEWLTPEDVVPLFEQALRDYGLHDWQVMVRDGLVTDCAAGDKRLFLRAGARFTKQHVQALVTHEIETHVLTSENGQMQPYELFRRGFANYLDTQEGLAIYNQNRVLSAYSEKRFHHARSVLAAKYALGHSFADTRRYLVEALHYRPEKALGKTIELKRGLADTAEPGCFTKTLVYFRGLKAIERYIASGGDMKALYMGKIAVEDLPVLRQVEGVKPALLIPSYLRQQGAPKPQKSKQRKKAAADGTDAQQEEE